MTPDAVHCPRCGGRLPAPPPSICEGCGYHVFLNARPTGTSVIVAEGAYLVVRRGREPHAGRWDLPGGFANAWEHPADAAVREAREELGVEVELRDFLGMYVGRYPYQREVLPVLDCFWTAEIVAGEIVLDAENTEYDWVPLAAEPDLAFETMTAAIFELQRRLGLRPPGN